MEILLEHMEIILVIVVTVGAIIFASVMEPKLRVKEVENKLVEREVLTPYLKKTLVSGEKVIYQAKISLRLLFTKITFGMVFLLFGLTYKFSIVIAILFFLAAYIQYTSIELAFTNKRVLAKFGFIKRIAIEMNINKIESIQVRQNILGRIFNYGSIIITGSGNPQVPITNISNPLVFRNKFMEYTMK
ncbi:MAG: PH domain-containing protein [Campylobacteraceae bacterium]|jgi:hypothetical protein|nr:PH domain-containing protein [Campylobacteraceae bacterium]